MHLLASAAALAPERRRSWSSARASDQLEKALAGSGCDRGAGTAARHRPCRAAGRSGAGGLFEGDVLILYGDVPFVTDRHHAER
jgi:bifunctional UDP-N-acetylglucosamine pyrophosphorylase/glucosamine-1-phosphate N-acetyltransferase